MDIIIVTPFENFLSRRGNRLPFLANLLVKSGFKVEYISSDFYHAEKRFFSKEEMDNAQHQVRVNQIFFHVPGYFSNFSIWRTVTHLIFSIKIFFYLLSHSTPSLVVIPSRPPEMIFAVSAVKLIKRYKMIIDVSDIWPDGFPKKGILFVLFSMYCNFFHYLSLPFQKNYVITAPMFINWIYRYKKKFSYRFITLGFDDERWEKSCPLENIDKEKKFVYIGNIDQTINLYPFINGVKNFMDCSLTIIGAGDRIVETKDFIKNNNIKNVFFSGFLDKEILPAAVHGFHISVIPMIKGTLPNKLFDSLGGYKPILGFGNNDTTKFVDKNDIGWVLNFDEQEVIKFLKDITNEEILKKSKNIEKIRGQYAKEYIYQQFVEYITKIVQ